MLKKISAAETRMGMYVHKLDVAWIDSPFWQSAFPVDSTDILDKLHAAGSLDVWIDTRRGADLERTVQAAPAPAQQAAAAAQTFTFAPVVRTSISQEMTLAAKTIVRARSAVMGMFEEVRMGRLYDLTPARAMIDEIAASVMRNQGALISLVRIKQADDYTYLHSVAVCAMMIALARQLKLPDHEVRDCGLAGLLHDVGKVAIAPHILNKPGMLTAEEFELVKRHPLEGAALLAGWAGVSPIARDVCLHHHERYDGDGYPHRLLGERISLHARMGAICDVYDAITSDRSYKAGWCPAESVGRMADWTRAGKFDPALFAAFVNCVGIHPVGTLVQLKSGRLGVVTDLGKSLVKPVVKVFFSTRAMAFIAPQEVDLAIPGLQEGIARREDPAKWKFGDLSRYWMPA